MTATFSINLDLLRDSELVRPERFSDAHRVLVFSSPDVRRTFIKASDPAGHAAHAFLRLPAKDFVKLLIQNMWENSRLDLRGGFQLTSLFLQVKLNSL